MRKRSERERERDRERERVRERERDDIFLFGGDNILNRTSQVCHTIGSLTFQIEGVRQCRTLNVHGIKPDSELRLVGFIEAYKIKMKNSVLKIICYKL